MPAGDPGERSELVEPTFSTNGGAFFVNLQSPGITYAVWAPAEEPTAARQRQMAYADAPNNLRPRVSGGLSEAAHRHGMTEPEAAAYDHLGVPPVW